jgi:hypothetical protein
MVIFHGYVSHNQRVISKCLQLDFWSPEMAIEREGERIIGYSCTIPKMGRSPSGGFMALWFQHVSQFKAPLTVCVSTKKKVKLGKNGECVGRGCVISFLFKTIDWNIILGGVPHSHPKTSTYFHNRILSDVSLGCRFPGHPQQARQHFGQRAWWGTGVGKHVA